MPVARVAVADAFPEHPPTYVLPQDYEAFQQAAAAGKSGRIWIVKPTSLYGGQGMHLLDDPTAVPREAGHIVQEYLAEPYLVKGHKAHLRLYILITSVAPLRAYLWADGIVRIAPEPFRQAPGWLDRPCHPHHQHGPSQGPSRPQADCRTGKSRTRGISGRSAPSCVTSSRRAAT